MSIEIFLRSDLSDIITEEAGFLNGHGTDVLDDGGVFSCVGGVVERLNKLVSVRPIRSRYTPEVGDIVIGRVTEVTQKKWKIDIGSRRHATLMLSGVNLPGGTLRRRSTADELNMRKFFVENDIISAEVQQTYSDGSVALHTRNLRYGKMQNGVLIKVPRLIVLGVNGWIWISKAPNWHHGGVEGVVEAHNMPAHMQSVQVVAQDRELISRVRNAVAVLTLADLPISQDTIGDVFAAGLNQPPKYTTNPRNFDEVIQNALVRCKKELSADPG